jgi:hypothetical protein
MLRDVLGTVLTAIKHRSTHPAVVHCVALVPVERRVRSPVLVLSLSASRQFTAINVVTVVFYGALAAAGHLLVLRCELTLGYTAAQAGAVPIPSSVIFLGLSPVAGRLARGSGRAGS